MDQISRLKDRLVCRLFIISLLGAEPVSRVDQPVNYQGNGGLPDARAACTKGFGQVSFRRKALTARKCHL